MNISRNLRQIRLKLGLTQKQVSELTCIAEPTIRRYELGKLNPKYETIERIAKALDVTVEELAPVGISNLGEEAKTSIITARINLLLKKEGLSRRQLAVKAGIPTSSFQAAMARGNMSTDMLTGVARALGVSADYLLGLSNIPFPYKNDIRYISTIVYELKARIDAACEEYIASQKGESNRE